MVKWTDEAWIKWWWNSQKTKAVLQLCIYFALASMFFFNLIVKQFLRNSFDLKYSFFEFMFLLFFSLLNKAVIWKQISICTCYIPQVLQEIFTFYSLTLMLNNWIILFFFKVSFIAISYYLIIYTNVKTREDLYFCL